MLADELGIVIVYILCATAKTNRFLDKRDLSLSIASYILITRFAASYSNIRRHQHIPASRPNCAPRPRALISSHPTTPRGSAAPPQCPHGFRNTKSPSCRTWLIKLASDSMRRPALPMRALTMSPWHIHHSGANHVPRRPHVPSKAIH